MTDITDKIAALGPKGRVKEFPAPGPWITRDLKPCVLADDYRRAIAERDLALEVLREARREVSIWLTPDCEMLAEIDALLAACGKGEG